MTPEEVDDAIERWHTGDSELPLHEFLGWSRQEYSIWVETNVIPNR